MTPDEKPTLPPKPEGGGSFTLINGKYVRDLHEDEASAPTKTKKESR